MALPHYNYDSEDFYEAIETLAKNGAKDNEIAIALKHHLGFSLEPTTFNRMKNGKYDVWTKEENECRGARIRQVLLGARHDINRIVKAVYLSTALGKHQTKTTTTVRRRLRIDGQLTENEEIQTTEVVSGISPNLQALALWLTHHDPDWRRIQRGGDDMEEEGGAPIPERVKKGVDVGSWLDKELLDDANDDENDDSGESKV